MFIAAAKYDTRREDKGVFLLKQIKTDDIGWAPRIPQVDAFYAELSKTR